MLFDRIDLKVFAKPEEDVDRVREAFVDLIPFEFKVEASKAQGFNERMIHIFSAIIKKTSRTNAFFKSFLGRLSDAQRELLVSQADSRLDDRLDFFVRIDKEPWINDRKLFFTDSGACFHIRFSLAVFPRKRDKALNMIKDLFEKSF